LARRDCVGGADVVGEVWLSTTTRTWPTSAAEYQPGVQVAEIRPQVVQFSAGGAPHVSPDPAKVALYDGYVRGTWAQLESFRDWYGYTLGMARPFPVKIGTLNRADVVRFDRFELRRAHLEGELWDLSIGLRSDAHGPGW
jgi:hypothetical protein